MQNIIFEEDLAMQNVTIKSKYKDAATDIIRNVIRNKDSLVVGQWSCNIYIKAVQQDCLIKTVIQKKTKLPQQTRHSRHGYDGDFA